MQERVKKPTFDVIGTRPVRPDGVDKVTGRAAFGADYQLPGMLEGAEVPAEAQIIGMCEAFDALTSERPYRRAMPRAEALEVMRGLSGTRFDPYLLSRFEDVAAPTEA